MDQFQHSDGRIFTLVGTEPHTTRDGREVNLKLWETSCTHPGCTKTFTVKTAIDDPRKWKNFQPRKFCPVHLAIMKRQEHSRLVKVRAEGLRKWMASEEGQAALKERERNKMGSVDKTLYHAICDISLAEDVISWKDAKRNAIDRLPPPKEGKRDTRVYRVERSLMHLILKGFISHTNGMITLLR